MGVPVKGSSVVPVDQDEFATSINSRVTRGPFRLQQRQPGVHALQAGVGPDPVQAAQEPWLRDRPVQRLVGGRALQGLGEVQPQVGFLDLSGRLVMGQVAVISALRAVR